MSKIVRVKAGTPLSAEHREELLKLADSPDSEIDFSDIPELPDAFWQKAVTGGFYRPLKEQVTVRIDADVLAWLKGRGRGYQTRLNAVLRQAMTREAKARKAG